MTKKWTYEEYHYALQSSWSAFENTLRTHGVTDKEIQKFVKVNDSKDNYSSVSDALAEVITWKEELWVK